MLATSLAMRGQPWVKPGHDGLAKVRKQQSAVVLMLDPVSTKSAPFTLAD